MNKSSQRYVRFTKTVLVPIKKDESVWDAVERADILDSEAALEYELTTEIVDANNEVLEVL